MRPGRQIQRRRFHVDFGNGQFTYADFWNVEFIAYGSTFEGQSYVVESQDRIYSNPY